MSQKCLIVFFVLWIISLDAKAQVTFNNTYHVAIDNDFNVLCDSIGYIKVMLSYNPPFTRYIYQKVDSAGMVITSKPYGTSTEYYIIYSLNRTYDNNLIIGSYCRDLSSQKVFAYLAKLNHIGDTLWTKKYQAPAGFDFYGDYMIETSDRGFLITGEIADSALTDGDIFILKADSVGNFQWMNTFGGPKFDAGYSSVETSDGGYLTAGWTRSYGFGNNSNRDDIVIKWDSMGNYEWHQSYGSIFNETAIGIIKLDDGNYIVSSGRNDLTLNIPNGKIIKINENGVVIWTRFYGIGIDSFRWVREMSNTDLVGITSIRVNGLDDGFIIRTDSSGNEIWRRQYRYGNSHCYFRDVQETSDGGIICAGFVFQGASGNQDGWLVKLDSTGCLLPGKCGEPTGLFEATAASPFVISVSPNPVSTEALVKVDGLSLRLLSEPYRLRVYDITGRVVQEPQTGFLVSDSWIECIFKPQNLSSGTYLVEVSTYSQERLGIVKVVIQ